MKTVSICAWRRPDYTKRILDGLARNPKISEYEIFASVEAAGKFKTKQEHVVSELKRVTFAKCHVYVATKSLGCNMNTLRSLQKPFDAGSDFNIHVEDDVLLAPDAIEYFEWARQFDRDQSLFIVSAWRHRLGWLPGCGRDKNEYEDYQVSADPGLGIWGWATWASRWPEILSRWTKESNDFKDSWDCHLDNNVRGERRSLAPLVSRSCNIGKNDATHGSPPPITYWSGDTAFSPKPGNPFFVQT